MALDLQGPEVAAWLDAARGPLALVADLGGTKIAYGLARPGGDVLPLGRLATPAQAGGEAVMRALLGGFVSIGAQLGDAAMGVAAVGVAAAGVVDPLAGRVVAANGNLPGWAGMPIAQRFREAGWSCPVAVENDADAAALGEALQGAGRGAHSVAMLTVGTGVGGGLVWGGRLHRGARHRAMELGAMLLAPDGEPDPTGRRGALEGLAAGPAYDQAAASLGLDAPGLFAAAEAGDPAAEAALQGPIGALARAIANLGVVLDPERVVVGGGVAEQPSLLPRLRRALAEPAVAGHLPYPPEAVVLAALGNRAGLMGAAEAAFARLA